MAGVKGRSGGARPGAGRKPREKVVEPINAQTPVEFLEEVMRNNALDMTLRVRAAAFAAPYRHTKKGEGGKVQEKKSAAEAAGGGKFAPSSPPQLKAVK